MTDAQKLEALNLGFQGLSNKVTQLMFQQRSLEMAISSYLDTDAKGEFQKHVVGAQTLLNARLKTAALGATDVAGSARYTSNLEKLKEDAEQYDAMDHYNKAIKKEKKEARNAGPQLVIPK